MCVPTSQPDTKSNYKCNPTTSTKQHAMVNIQLNIVACPTYAETVIPGHVVASFLLLSVLSLSLAYELMIAFRLELDCESV